MLCRHQCLLVRAQGVLVHRPASAYIGQALSKLEYKQKYYYHYGTARRLTEANEALFGDATPAEICYTYDQAGYVTSVSYPHGSVTINTTPDHAGRIDTLKLGAFEMLTYDYVGPRVAKRAYTRASPDIEYQPDYDGLGRVASADSGTSFSKFDYQYDANSNNVSKMTYDHRSGDPCTDFTYDRLDRLTIAEYGIGDNNEVFTIDDLGNRDNVNMRDGSDVNYVIDDLTNRYETVDGNSLAYDEAGNLITNVADYNFTYDYENRIIKITKDGNDIAEFAYDALGRRIRKIDSIAGTTRLYFYNDKWQVLTETDASETMKAWYAYGNYIDEVLLTAPANFWVLTRYYVHDHLYSPAALAAGNGTVLERYEYDAYGEPTIWDATFSSERSSSSYDNPYYFTGRRADFLDGNSLTLQINRHRYYDYYTGRWLTHDPLGVDPAGYVDGMNLYQYVRSNPVWLVDPAGLVGASCNCCEYLYIKQCWVIRRSLEHNVMVGAVWVGSVSSQNISLALLQGLANFAAMTVGQIVSTAASTILAAFPSLANTTTIRLRPAKVERFRFMKLECGDDFKWDYGAATNRTHTEDHEGFWRESPIIPASWLFIKPAARDIVKQHRAEFLQFWLTSRYCRFGGLRCKKGDQVDPDGTGTTQACESFEWKTKD
ncbi:MAG: RHS repeat domain-containing protein [Planctomycetota bacterium]|jgi:RHS repeat-associated protein